MDPTPFVYDQTMYVMAGLCSMAFITNQFLRPVDPKYHIKPAEVVSIRGIDDMNDSSKNTK